MTSDRWTCSSEAQASSDTLDKEKDEENAGRACSLRTWIGEEEHQIAPNKTSVDSHPRFTDHRSRR